MCSNVMNVSGVEMHCIGSAIPQRKETVAMAERAIKDTLMSVVSMKYGKIELSDASSY